MLIRVLVSGSEEVWRHKITAKAVKQSLKHLI
jgi:hypothetical protein